MSTLNVDKVDPSTGTDLELGTSGDTINIPSGVTIANAGTATGFGGISWQSVVTGSTMTAVAGEGYPIDTSSNTCTITLPASASVGDTIVFADYARNWGTNKIIIDSNGLNYQGASDASFVSYGIDGTALRIVYMDATKGWIPTVAGAVADSSGNSEGIFGYGYDGGNLTMSNLVSNTGVVTTDVLGVGTARRGVAACEYGIDTGIFGYGKNAALSMTNLVSNAGVVATDTTGVGTARSYPGACRYGTDKGIFAYGKDATTEVSMSNLVSNTGVVATDVTGVGTSRQGIAACEYGTDTGIFGYGYTGSAVSMSNLVSNTGVVATDVTGVGTARFNLAACGYGGDKGIFGYGETLSSDVSMTNLVSNGGVVATDTTGVGTARRATAACEYGTDTGIFGYGYIGSNLSMTNLVSNAGVVATDTTGVGTARQSLAACSFN